MEIQSSFGRQKALAFIPFGVPWPRLSLAFDKPSEEPA
jgi:hypothetical protein